jgi:hypothetical protein
VGVAEGPEEGRALLGVVAELMTQDAEGAGRIPEAASRFDGREPIDEIGTEGFVLAMERLLGGKEEVRGLGFR